MQTPQWMSTVYEYHGHMKIRIRYPMEQIGKAWCSRQDRCCDRHIYDSCMLLFHNYVPLLFSVFIIAQAASSVNVPKVSHTTKRLPASGSLPILFLYWYRDFPYLIFLKIFCTRITGRLIRIYRVGIPPNIPIVPTRNILPIWFMSFPLFCLFSWLQRA